MGSYVLTLFFCNFRGKEYYLISLRSIQIQIFCLWLKYAFFVNSKHYSRSNGTKGNFKLRKDLLLNSVLQALLSVTCFPQDSLDRSTIAGTAPHRVQVLKMYSMLF